MGKIFKVGVLNEVVQMTANQKIFKGSLNEKISSKIGQDQKTLISAFVRVLTTVAKK